jgi:gamma-glutamyl hydrolase
MIDANYDNYTSYIMSTYVDFIMSSGARVIPLIVTESREVTLEKLKKLNGVFLPGGDGDYVEYGRFIYETIKEFNDNGTYYPLWGTCLGFENLAIWASEEGPSVLESYHLAHGSIPLEFVVDPRETQMFGWLQEKAHYLTTEPILYNSHSWSINPEKF